MVKSRRFARFAAQNFVIFAFLASVKPRGVTHLYEVKFRRDLKLRARDSSEFIGVYAGNRVAKLYADFTNDRELLISPQAAWRRFYARLEPRG
jgi:hypothetical protein